MDVMAYQSPFISHISNNLGAALGKSRKPFLFIRALLEDSFVGSPSERQMHPTEHCLAAAQHGPGLCAPHAEPCCSVLRSRARSVQLSIAPRRSWAMAGSKAEIAQPSLAQVQAASGECLSVKSTGQTRVA